PQLLSERPDTAEGHGHGSQDHTEAQDGRASERALKADAMRGAPEGRGVEGAKAEEPDRQVDGEAEQERKGEHRKQVGPAAAPSPTQAAQGAREEEPRAQRAQPGTPHEEVRDAAVPPAGPEEV